MLSWISLGWKMLFGWSTPDPFWRFVGLNPGSTVSVLSGLQSVRWHGLEATEMAGSGFVLLS